jgi:DNA polymerase-3 subunit beta
MKFIAEQKDMKEALSNLSNCVPKTTNINNVLSGVVMELYDNRLLLKGTNLNIFLQQTVPVESLEENNIIIQFDILKSLISKFPDGPIRFELKDNEMVLSQNKIKYNIPIYADVEQFPKEPTVLEGPEFEIKEYLLQGIIKRLIKSVSKQGSTPFMESMNINIIDEKSIDFVATDTFRLFLYEYKPTSLIKRFRSREVMISYQTMQNLKSVLGNSEEMIRVRIGESFVNFKIGNKTLKARMVEGNYPKYKSIIPDENQLTVEISKDEMKGSIGRVKTISKFHSDNSIATIKIKDDDLLLTPLEGSGEEVIPLNEKRGNDKIEISLNADYLTDYLSLSDSEVVEMNFIDKSNPITIKEGNLTYIIMPTRS